MVIANGNSFAVVVESFRMLQPSAPAVVRIGLILGVYELPERVAEIMRHSVIIHPGFHKAWHRHRHIFFGGSVWRGGSNRSRSSYSYRSSGYGCGSAGYRHLFNLKR